MLNPRSFIAGLLTLCFWSCSLQAQRVKQVDILIKNAIVFDGTGGDSASLNVGITGGKISFIGKKGRKNPGATRVIDAGGLYLAPGFIDPHTHVESDLSSEKGRNNLPYLMQGVTTVFAGNDGTSALPIGTKLKKWQEQGVGTNVGLFIGHGSVRKVVLGSRSIAPDSVQLRAMQDLVRASMDEGAFGLSTGLFYAPGSFADKEEVVALATIVAASHGIYDTHVRDEGSFSVGLMNSIQETLDIGKEAGIPVHISHIKALGTDVWGKSDSVIARIEKAQAAGLRVTANHYPYVASRTNLIAAVVPRWAEDGGYEALVQRFDDGASDSLRRGISENIRRRGGPASLVFSSSQRSELENRSLEDVSRAWGVTPAEAVIQILRADREIRVVSFNMMEKDVDRFISRPWVMTGSDGTPGHPRKYGTFTKKIREYVLDRKMISMAFAVHVSSGLTATTLGIARRGFIRVGYAADVILFDPLKLKDRATFEKPDQLSEGMVYVLVNGVVSIEQGKYTGSLAGKTLRLNDQ